MTHRTVAFVLFPGMLKRVAEHLANLQARTACTSS